MLQASWKALAAIVAAFGFAGGATWAAPGDLQPGYGNNGAVDVRIGPGVEQFTTMLAQPDGKLVAVGWLTQLGTRAEIALARFNADGTKDLGFGIGGLVRHDPRRPIQPIAAALQPDGKILVLSMCPPTGELSTPGGDVSTCLHRFEGTGALDPTFVAPATFSSRSARRLVAQPDGKIVLAIRGGSLMRLLPSGPLDTSFGSQGIAASNAGSNDVPRALTMGGDGAFVVASGPASGSESPTVRRFSAAGVLDTSYAPSIGGSNEWHAALVESDGRVVLAGCTNGANGIPMRLTIVRLASNGFLDTTFNGTGVAQPADLFCAKSMLRRTDGRYVIASEYQGYITPGVSSPYHVAQLNNDGTPDASFSGGAVAVSAGSAKQISRAVALRAGGGLVVGGERDGRQMALVGLAANGSADASFFGGAPAIADFRTGRGGRLREMRIDAAGRAIVLANLIEPSTVFPNMGEVGLARITPLGVMDSSFGAQGSVVSTLAPNAAVGQTANQARALGLQADGKILVGGRAVGNTPQAGVVMRFNADGSVDTGFASNGRFVIDNTYGEIRVEAVEALPDGKILYAYRASTPPPTGCCVNTMESYVGRLTASGALDPSFGNQGVTRLQPAGSNADPDTSRLRLAVLPDGRLVVSGSHPGAMSAVRLLADGTQDAAFGSGGLASFLIANGTQGLVVQSDGHLTLVGTLRAGLSGECGNGTPYDFMAFARTSADGVVDSGTPGEGVVREGLTNQYPGLWSATRGGDDRLVAAGYRRNHCVGRFSPVRGKAMVIRFAPGGGVDPTFGRGGVVELGNNYSTDNHARDVVVTNDGILAAAENSEIGQAFTVYLLQGSGGGGPVPLPNDLDGDGTADGSDASPLVPGPTPTVAATVTLSIGGGTGGVVESTQTTLLCSGTTCDASYVQGSLVTFKAVPAFDSVFTGWSGAGCSGLGDCTLTMDSAKSLTANFAAQDSGPRLTPAPVSIAFGPSSLTTPTQGTVQLTNTGTTTNTVASVTTDMPAFAAAHDCGVLAVGASCTVTVTFTPGALTQVAGSLTIGADGGPYSVPLSGSGSLVKHYYNRILGRQPDASGDSFWHSELRRLAALGADINEVWYLMAGYFFNSAEYIAANKDNAQYISDLYTAFFNRTPDPGGGAFWQQQLAGGLPREIVMFSFLFSQEFRDFTQGIYGNTAAPARVNVVTDFYRGFFNRFPDSAAFDFWVNQVRTADCQGTTALDGALESISSNFLGSPEYTNRGRTNVQFVGDLYYTFLRRGGDKAGVDSWVSRLDSGQLTRNQVRQQFLQTNEFRSTRIQAFINEPGC